MVARRASTARLSRRPRSHSLRNREEVKRYAGLRNSRRPSARGPKRFSQQIDTVLLLVDVEAVQCLGHLLACLLRG
jgi:hypothetical protein